MISTTFIIGAGVSMPFGFPSGMALMSSVRKLVANLHPTIYNDLVTQSIENYSISTHVEFIESVARTPHNSIDAFVYNNPEYGEYAKLAIACILLDAEYNNLNNCIDIDHENKSVNVLMYLWNKFCRSRNVAEELSKHRFITFNYDRVLEHFIYNSCLPLSSMNQEEAVEMFEQAKIHHVYGSLGHYNPVDPHNISDGEPYLGNVTPAYLANILRAVKSLSLMTSERSDPTGFKSFFEEAMMNTQMTVFLGFGYDPINCLFIRDAHIDIINENPDSYVQTSRSLWYGSAMGKVHAERESAAHLLDIDENKLGQESMDDVLFLRNYIYDM